MLTYMQEVKIVKKIHKYPKKHCACLLLLEAEGKSLLADHRSCTIFIHQELYILTVQFVAMRNYLRLQHTAWLTALKTLLYTRAISI